MGCIEFLEFYTDNEYIFMGSMTNISICNRMTNYIYPTFHDEGYEMSDSLSPAIIDVRSTTFQLI